MRDFKSICCRQISPVITIPHKANAMKGYVKILLVGSTSEETRIIPYPPSFSKTAARIMEPAIGASTCALGSHRWTP